jgi:hypothetical protein
MPSGQDILSKIANGAFRAYMIHDQRKYETGQQQQRQQANMQFMREQSAGAQARDEARYDFETQRDEDRAERDRRAGAFDAILRAVRAGAKVTPELQERALSLEVADEQTTRMILDATASGVEAGVTREKEELETRGSQSLSEIRERGAQSRLTDSAKPDKEKEPKPVDYGKRSSAIRGLLDEWRMEPGRRSNKPRPGQAPQGMEQDQYEFALAEIMTDDPQNAPTVRHAERQFATEQAALQLANVAGVDPSMVDEPLIDGQRFTEIAESMGVEVPNANEKLSLLEIASTGNIQTVSRILQVYYQRVSPSYQPVQRTGRREP